MKYFWTSFLLSAAIVIIAIGVQTDNFILMCIGGGSVGVYDAMIHDQD